MNLNYKVVYTDSAIDDLNSILSYLSGYGNPNILTYFKKEIDNKLEIIKNFLSLLIFLIISYISKQKRAIPNKNHSLNFRF